MKTNLSAVSKYKFIAALLIIVVIAVGMSLWLTRGDNPMSHNTPGEADTSVSMEGTVLCLPHKNTDGPQTMECAYGLKTAEGVYYSLRDTSASYQNIASAQMNTQVVVKGTLHKEQGSTYPTIGVIAVESITKQ